MYSFSLLHVLKMQPHSWRGGVGWSWLFSHTLAFLLCALTCDNVLYRWDVFVSVLSKLCSKRIKKVLFHVFFLKVFTYLRGRGTHRVKFTQSSHPGSLPRCPQWPGLCWGLQQGPEIQRRSPTFRQEPKFLSHHHWLLGSSLAGSWSQELELESNPGSSIWGVGILTTKLNA